MISFAEYFALQKDVPRENFEVGFHASRISFSFYAYAMAKQIYGYETEGDNVVADGARGKKRTRGVKLQSKKRKFAGNPGRGNKDKNKIIEIV